jgi:hypothetical protein
VLNEDMNETEITRIVADAFREAVNIAGGTSPEADNVRNVLFDLGVSLADEIWPNQSEESPVMPEEWLDALEGK